MIRKLRLLLVDAANANKKGLFYWGHLLRKFLPDSASTTFSYPAKDDLEAAYIDERISYYHKHTDRFTVQNQTPIQQIKVPSKRKLKNKLNLPNVYAVDIARATRGFDRSIRLDYLIGDIRHIPPCPTIVKSRPISGRNENSVLLKLDSPRHFHFVRDPLPFAQKKNLAVWRGKVANNLLREVLLQQHAQSPFCDLGDTDRRKYRSRATRPYLPLSAQLAYKFVISVEGCDTATNVKWIMSSNCLCLMPKPTMETWFMEGKLVAGHHYVQLADDFGDLEDKIEHYLKNLDEALAIVKNANIYVAQFLNKKREQYISRMVLTKYLENSGQP